METEVVYRKAALEMRKAVSEVCRAELEARAAEVKLSKCADTTASRHTQFGPNGLDNLGSRGPGYSAT